MVEGCTLLTGPVPEALQATRCRWTRGGGLAGKAGPGSRAAGAEGSGPLLADDSVKPVQAACNPWAGGGSQDPFLLPGKMAPCPVDMPWPLSCLGAQAAPASLALVNALLFNLKIAETL